MAVGASAVKTRVSATTATGAATQSTAPAPVSRDSRGNTANGVSRRVADAGNLQNRAAGTVIFRIIPSRKSRGLQGSRLSSRLDSSPNLNSRKVIFRLVLDSAAIFNVNTSCE